jgi:hypothetical protein
MAEFVVEDLQLLMKSEPTIARAAYVVLIEAYKRQSFRPLSNALVGK